MEGITTKNLTIFLILMLFVLPTSVNVISTVETKIIYVDDDNTEGPWNGTVNHPFQHIQDGINASSDGVIVFVCSGTYYENIFVEKSITVIGADRNFTIIDANQSGSAILIRADEVDIMGFTLQNSGHDYWNSGVEIYASYCKINNNVIRYNRHGVVIHWHCPSNIISNNSITENWLNAPYGAAGVDCTTSWNTNICNNKIFNNLGAGVNIYTSDDLYSTRILLKITRGVD